MIKLDKTQHSVVVKCSACPWYSGFGFDQTDGWRVGRNHEQTMHPGSSQAAKALHNAEQK